MCSRSSTASSAGTSPATAWSLQSGKSTFKPECNSGLHVDPLVRLQDRSNAVTSHRPLSRAPPVCPNEWEDYMTRRSSVRIRLGAKAPVAQWVERLRLPEH